jgi:NRPS condensation-like uncharacterized protein
MRTITDTVDSAHGDLLPLTPFEKMLLANDAPEHPMTYRILLRLRGVLNTELLQKCYLRALVRHPLLHSCIVREGRKLCWKLLPPGRLSISEFSLPQVAAVTAGGHSDYESDGWTSRDIGSPDLTRSAGLTTIVRHLHDRVWILLDTHHSCADGNGMRQFVAEWLHLYHCETTGEASRLPALEPTRLRTRSVLPSFRSESVNTGTVSIREHIRNFLHTVRGRTATMPRLAQTKVRQQGSGRNAEKTYSTERVLTGDALAAVERLLDEYQVTVNDLLTTACMFEMHRCIPATSGEDRITVLNPVDLRMPSDRRMPAANRVGFAFLRRRRSDCVSLKSLLPTIRDEMLYIKRGRVAGEFLHGLAAADRIPGGLAVARRLALFRPSVQLTCLGDVTRRPGNLLPLENDRLRIGELLLDSTTGFPPVAPDVPYSVSVCLSRTNLTLAVRGSCSFVTAEQVDCFADALSRCITE